MSDLPIAEELRQQLAAALGKADPWESLMDTVDRLLPVVAPRLELALWLHSEQTELLGSARAEVQQLRAERDQARSELLQAAGFAASAMQMVQQVTADRDVLTARLEDRDRRPAFKRGESVRNRHTGMLLTVVGDLADWDPADFVAVYPPGHRFAGRERPCEHGILRGMMTCPQCDPEQQAAAEQHATEATRDRRGDG